MPCARYVDTYRSAHRSRCPAAGRHPRVQLPPHSAVTSPKSAPISTSDACSIHGAHFPGKAKVELRGFELLEAFNKSPLKCSGHAGGWGGREEGMTPTPYLSPHNENHSAQPVGLVPTHPPLHPLLSLPSPVDSLGCLKWLATQLPYISMFTTSICWEKKSRS